MAEWRPRLPLPAPPEPPGSLSLPLVEALVTERRQRETTGVGRLPDGSPLAALPDPSLETLLETLAGRLDVRAEA